MAELVICLAASVPLVVNRHQLTRMPNRSFGRTSRGQTISISAERVTGQTKRNRQNFIGLVFDVRIGRTWDPENKKQANYVHWCRVSSGTKTKRARVVAECRTCITWQGNKGGPARDQRV